MAVGWLLAVDLWRVIEDSFESMHGCCYDFNYLKYMNTDLIPWMFSLFAFKCAVRISIRSDSTLPGCFVSECLSKTKT